MFNHCPKCNSKKIVFIEQRYFVCPCCKFTYFHNVASAVAAVIVVGNEILFTYRAKQPGKGLLDLPGGFVDPNETLEQALTREITEELSLNITRWQYLCSQANSYLYKEINYQTLDSFFVAYLPEKPSIKLQHSEVSAVSWQRVSDINFDELSFDSVKAALKFYLDTKKL